MKSISHKSYEASLRKIEDLQIPAVSALSKTVLNEMKCVSLTTSATLLRYSNEELKQYSWDALWQEMQAKMPILVAFLQQILPKATSFHDSKNYICYVL